MDEQAGKKKGESGTLKDLYDQAIIEMGLSKEEFWGLPPYQFYLIQLRHMRKIERRWEQTRAIVAMQHNTAMGKKRNLRPTDIVRLSFDRKVEYEEWTQDDALDLINKWPDIKKN